MMDVLAWQRSLHVPEYHTVGLRNIPLSLEICCCYEVSQVETEQLRVEPSESLHLEI